MNFDPTIKWLILEQAGEQDHWGIKEHRKGLVWRDSALIFDAPDRNHSPVNGEICLLFLTTTAKTDLLPEAFADAQARDFRVWCHYGGDVNPGRVAEQWATKYDRLTSKDRERLFPPGTGHPLPFSRSQTKLEWTEEFETIKKLVGRSVANPEQSSRYRTETMTALDAAWRKASQSVSFQMKVSQLNLASHFVLAAKFIRAAFPKNFTSSRALLERILELRQSNGLAEGVHEKEHFPRAVRDTYRILLHRMAQARLDLRRHDAVLAEPDNDNAPLVKAAIDFQLRSSLLRVLQALEDFIGCYEQESRATTRGLAGSRTIGARKL